MTTRDSTDVEMDIESPDVLLDEINDKATETLYPVLGVCGLLMLVGTIGNTLVVYVYLRRMKSSAKRTFILALAILDLSACIIMIPFEMFDLIHQATFTKDAPCKAMRFLEYTTILSAGFVLVSISFERYYFLCKAFQEFTTRKAKLICVACVIMAFIVSVPAAILAGSKTRHYVYKNSNVTGSECSMNSETTSDKRMKRIYYYCLAVIFFGCFVMFAVIYLIIGRLLWMYQRGTLAPASGRFYTPETSSGVMSGNKSSSGKLYSCQSTHSLASIELADSCVHGRKPIKSAGSIVIFFSVTVVFVVSFLPHITIRLMLFFGWDLYENFDKENGDLFYNFVVRSYMISNVANPFIYSILNKTFREELKRTFRKIDFCLRSSKEQKVTER